MLKHLKRNLINNVKNFPGWQTNKKIVAVEADDFGGIRMPSREVYDKLISLGLNLGSGRFNKYDTLANKKDLESLFEVLYSVKDQHGQPAVMTPVVNVANPDFEKIKASNFKEYQNEPFTQTLKRYYGNDEPFPLWKKGMQEGIFIPESHGREHISAQLWLKYLQKGNKQLLKAFDHGFVAVNIEDLPKPAKAFRPEFYFDHESQIPFLHHSITSSVNMFEDIFGYTPRIFVPGNSIFHPVFEMTLADNGIKYLNVNHFMQIPIGNGNIKKKFYRNHQTTKHGLKVYARNCVFEPTSGNYQGIEYTLKQIKAAFRWEKPAIISTHRVNFVGGIDLSNREKGLNELRKLLKAITHKWPETEFMSSAQMLNALEKDK